MPRLRLGVTCFACHRHNIVVGVFAIHCGGKGVCDTSLHFHVNLAIRHGRVTIRCMKAGVAGLEMQEGGFLVGEVGAANTPFFGVEVVGAVAEIVGESDGRALMCEQHNAARGIG